VQRARHRHPSDPSMRSAELSSAWPFSQRHLLGRCQKGVLFWITGCRGRQLSPRSGGPTSQDAGAVPWLLQHPAVSSAEPRGSKCPVPSAHIAVLCLTSDYQVPGSSEGRAPHPVLLVPVLVYTRVCPHSLQGEVQQHKVADLPPLGFLAVLFH